MRAQTKGLTFRTYLLAGTAVTGIMAISSAVAQDANPTQLAPIVIQGAGDETATSPVKGYVAKTSSTGSKSDTPLNEIPQSVSVIGKQEMDDHGITNKIDEALLYTPGVTTQPFGNDPDTDWFYIPRL